MEDKISSRNIEIIHEGNTFGLNTKNKLIMEYAQECVELTKGKKGDINKINAVRKHKGVCLPYEVLGKTGLKPTNCGMKKLERSSLSWKCNENQIKIKN